MSSDDVRADLTPGIRALFDSMGIAYESERIVVQAPETPVAPSATPEPDASMPPEVREASEPESPVAPSATGDFTCPSEPKDFIEPDWAHYLFRIWDTVKGVVSNVILLSGPRGTGKTLAAEVYAARRKRPIIKVNCTPDMTAESLLGTPRLDFKGGGDRWQPGPLMLAAQYGAVLLLDEFNAMSTAAQIAVNPIGDRDPATVFVPYTGESFVWHRPRVIACVNEGYTGTREIQPALRDRFETLQATYLPESREIDLVRGRTGLAFEIAERAVKTANAIRAAAAGNDTSVVPIDFDMSPRALLMFGARVMAGQSEADAWRQAVIGRAGYSIRTEAVRAALENISKTVGGFGGGF